MEAQRPPRPQRHRTTRPHLPQRLWRSLSPDQGWDTFGLLVLVLGVVAWTVGDGQRVETPGLLPITLWSSLSGLLLARRRAPAPVLHLAGLAIGFVVVVWQASSLIEEQSLAEQVRELWNRLVVWYEAVTSGGTSTDLIPYTLGLLATAWIVGYASSWFLFRSTNVWVGLVVGGIAILTAFDYLDGAGAWRLFLFLFFAMLLAARVSIFQVRHRWTRAGIRFGGTGVWSAMGGAAKLSSPAPSVLNGGDTVNSVGLDTAVMYDSSAPVKITMQSLTAGT